jgi:hypothetical protein
MSRLSITQAAHVCNFERSYFYKIIKKYNISIKKDLTNKSYIDISELVRSIPAEIINLDRLEQYTGQDLQTHETTSNNAEQQHDTILITQLKSEIDFLKNQLQINQQQVTYLLDTINRQTFLLENKTTQSNNTGTQKTTDSEALLKERKNVKEALNNLRKFQK